MYENSNDPAVQNMTSNIPQEKTASRWHRFVAAIIDTIILMLVTVPVVYFTGGFEGINEGYQPSTGYNLLMSFFSVCAFVLLNGKLLTSKGQTIGKKLINIRICTLEGDVPSLKNHLLKRYAIFFIPGQIPYIGNLFSIVNILYIFGEEKRCLHDKVAGTKVVDC